MQLVDRANDSFSYGPINAAHWLNGWLSAEIEVAR